MARWTIKQVAQLGTKKAKDMNQAEFRAAMQAKHAGAGRAKPSKHEESNLQQACVRWFRYQYRQHASLLFAIPNGSMLYGDERQRAITGRRLKAEGALPGAADLFFSFPSSGKHGLYIEMKTETGTQQATQQTFEQAVTAKGYGYVMPRSFEEFQAEIERYLSKHETKQP